MYSHIMHGLNAAPCLIGKVNAILVDVPKSELDSCSLCVEVYTEYLMGLTVFD